MSLFGQRPSPLAPTGLPEGQVIGSFSRYADAQKVVDHLSDQQFEVAAVSIVGHDLSSVERVTGRLSYPRVAMLSAAQGAMFGLFFGVILAMFGGSGWGMAVVLTILLGAAFWVILGVISFAAQRGRRDFTSVSTFVAARYDVVVRGDVAGDARQAVQGLNLAGLQQGGGFQPPARPVGQQAPGYNGGYPGQPPQAVQGEQPGQGGFGQSGSAQPGQAPHPGGAAQPAQQPQPTQQPQSTDKAASAQRPPLGEQDLPDGRPRYGVRIEPEQSANDPVPESGGSSGQATAGEDVGQPGR